MKFKISREELLQPLQLVVGVVERRQTLPILSNVLIVLKNNCLSMTGTDLEVEIVGHVMLRDPEANGEITVPARKLMDICRSLPDRYYVYRKRWKSSDNKRSEPIYALLPPG
jgi:DNA polymerase-3 subunit beta